MKTPSVADTLRALLPDDLGTLDTNGAAERLGLVKACRGHLDAYEARLTRHTDLLHAAGSSAPAADLHTPQRRRLLQGSPPE